MSSYVSFFYKEEEVVSDKELQEFWECIDKRGNRGCPDRYGLPILSKGKYMYMQVVATSPHL